MTWQNPEHSASQSGSVTLVMLSSAFTDLRDRRNLLITELEFNEA
ncbi:MAG: hypothetical protein VKK97_00995 [Synechococcaceae cyanobacterium]|jgi:hypothetical protein|nr:hypothetical protein [Synechococcaceae cyanobacterium]